jgi:N-acetylmuramic acid 6-phosphate (MurNAc-6-P) etherase
VGFADSAFAGSDFLVQAPDAPTAAARKPMKILVFNMTPPENFRGSFSIRSGIAIKIYLRILSRENGVKKTLETRRGF